MDPTADLLRRIEAFILREGLTPTVFGRKAASDPGCVFWLRKGRKPRAPTRDRIESFMRQAEEEAAA